MKGLTQGSDSGGGQKRAKSPSRPATQVPVKRPRQTQADSSATMSRSLQQQEEDDIQEVTPAVVKSEPGQEATPGQHLATYDEESYADYGQYDETQEYDGAMMADYQQAGLDGNKGKIFCTIVCLCVVVCCCCVLKVFLAGKILPEDLIPGQDRQVLQNYLELITTETGELKHKCTLCGSLSSQKQHAENHLENIHFQGYFKYDCADCGVSFDKRNKYYQHRSKCKSSFGKF